MNALKIGFWILFISVFINLQAYSQTEFSNADEVYDLIKGDWYQIIQYNGMTGTQDSVYYDHLHQIERIPGTDSITWKVSLHDSLLVTVKYKMEYTLCSIYHRNRWMLSSMPRLIINKTSYGFSTAWDARDGGAEGYARKKLTTSLDDPLQKEPIVFLFPNPTNGSFLIRGIENVEHIKVFNSHGRLLQSTDCHGSFPGVDISGLSNGIYLIQVITKDGIHTEKIIKE